MAFGVLDFNPIGDLLFDDVEDARDYRCLQLIRVNLSLLNMFPPKYQLEPVLDLRLRPTLDDVRDLAPFVAQFQPLFEEFLIFTEGPLGLFY